VRLKYAMSGQKALVEMNVASVSGHGEAERAGLARCPDCNLSLLNPPEQRDTRCPECLRTSGKAVVMQPIAERE
jgi:hypothetical protein